MLLTTRGKALYQHLSPSQPWFRHLAKARISPARLYSQGPRGDRRIQFDKTSTTYLGVTAGILLGGYYVAHLENAPETGRRRFMADIRKIVLEETLQEFRGKILPSNHPLTQNVRRVTRRIITASNLGHLEGDPKREPLVDFWGAGAEIPRPTSVHPEKEWVVLVINDKNFVNAFAAPGLVCVSTGIMPVARNEAGLAAIIRHEIGHVTMRHTAEHLSQAMILLPVTGLFLTFGIGPWIATWISTTLTKYFYSLPHSRALETEADTVGLKLISRACYDPGAAPR
ncbi:peptidase family M48-domain-containing protein [Mycena rosella]|uniref:Peptidase family M48-domain-containing protein n=1 Tax=Mycena rosella TaxID=1033263 RepID=A0AAD7CW88_MYCRO|nr:peptidase family M48-domain-containing protein [Mycena rosella]